jgi:hypothetical protein
MIVIVVLLTVLAVVWTVIWFLAQMSSPTGNQVLAPFITVWGSWLAVIAMWVAWYLGW